MARSQGAGAPRAWACRAAAHDLDAVAARLGRYARAGRRVRADLASSQPGLGVAPAGRGRLAGVDRRRRGHADDREQAAPTGGVLRRGEAGPAAALWRRLGRRHDLLPASARRVAAPVAGLRVLRLHQLRAGPEHRLVVPGGRARQPVARDLAGVRRGLLAATGTTPHVLLVSRLRIWAGSPGKSRAPRDMEGDARAVIAGPRAARQPSGRSVARGTVGSDRAVRRSLAEAEISSGGRTVRVAVGLPDACRPRRRR